MNRKRLSALMAEVGPLTDVLLVDEDHDKKLWRLLFDENLVIYAELDEERRVMVLSSDVAHLGETNRLALFELILRYQHAWDANGGARLSLSGNDRLWLTTDVALEGTDARRLSEIVCDLLQKRAGWREIAEHFPAEELEREERLDVFSRPGAIRS